MKKQIKIGYQGVAFSYNHYAAQKYIKTIKQSNIDLVPLISSKEVVKKLLEGKIDLGIMAVSNSTIGLINETQLAIAENYLLEITSIELVIKHAAFKFNKALKNNDIISVASHPAALEQCHNNILNNYPNAKLTPVENTALAPKYLVEGNIDRNSIVLCSKQAGEKYGLYLDSENLSDNQNNTTTFGVFKKIDKL